MKERLFFFIISVRNKEIYEIIGKYFGPDLFLAEGNRIKTKLITGDLR